MNIILRIFFLFFSSSITSAHSSGDLDSGDDFENFEYQESSLRKNLFENYNKKTRPVKNMDNTINLLYGLNEAVDMLQEDGLENVFARHARHGTATRSAARTGQPARSTMLSRLVKVSSAERLKAKMSNSAAARWVSTENSGTLWVRSCSSRSIHGA